MFAQEAIFQPGELVGILFWRRVFRSSMFRGCVYWDSVCWGSAFGRGGLGFGFDLGETLVDERDGQKSVGMEVFRGSGGGRRGDAVAVCGACSGGGDLFCGFGDRLFRDWLF